MKLLFTLMFFFSSTVSFAQSTINVEISKGSKVLPLIEYDKFLLIISAHESVNSTGSYLVAHTRGEYTNFRVTLNFPPKLFKNVKVDHVLKLLGTQRYSLNCKEAVTVESAELPTILCNDFELNFKN